MIVFGVREVLRALTSEIVLDEVFVCETIPANVLDSVKLGVGEAATQITMLTAEVFAKVSYGDRRDGVVAVGPRPETKLERLEITSPSLVLVAQAIEKPGNLGAIIRSADACGVSAVVVADPITDVFHPNSIRSSTGTVFGMPLGTGTSEEVQLWLERARLRVYTALLENAEDCFAADMTGDIAIVVGNEANGLSDRWKRDDYFPVKLPMRGTADSLNVSVTASIMLYESARQRQEKSSDPA